MDLIAQLELQLEQKDAELNGLKEQFRAVQQEAVVNAETANSSIARLQNQAHILQQEKIALMKVDTASGVPGCWTKYLLGLCLHLSGHSLKFTKQDTSYRGSNVLPYMSINYLSSNA